MMIGVKILQLIVCILFMVLVGYALPLIQQRMNDEKLNFVRKLTEISVYAVQQLHWDLPGEDRKQIAIKKITEILISYGIKITDQELNLLIEAAVKGMNIGREISK